MNNPKNYEVAISETLFRRVNCTTFDVTIEDDYTEMDDGNGGQVTWPSEYENWDGVYPTGDYKRDHKTAAELIEEFSKILDEDIKAMENDRIIRFGKELEEWKMRKLHLKYLKQECEGWEDDDMEIYRE